ECARQQVLVDDLRLPLQWSRRVHSAECTRAREQHREAPRASMEPPSSLGGMKPEHAPHVRYAAASMEPPSSLGGMLRDRLSALRLAVSGFNGAAEFTRRNVRDDLRL